MTERAIYTFKNHFKTCIAICDPAFPISQGDLLLPQACLTLSLLRSAHCNPKLSAYAYLNGNFNYSRTPLAPFGTKVVAHNKPSNRTSWALNGKEGWYIGPSLKHYRCVRGFFPKTNSTCHVDTVKFFPTVFRVPQMSLEDFLQQAALDLIALLTNPPFTTTFLPAAGDTTYNALLNLATIFKTADKLPALPLLKEASPPTVKPVSETRVQPAAEPRVQSKKSSKRTTPSTSVSTLTDKLSHRKRQRHQLPQRWYNLISRNIGTPFRHLATQQLLAQHLFILPFIHHFEIFFSHYRLITEFPYFFQVNFDVV